MIDGDSAFIRRFCGAFSRDEATSVRALASTTRTFRKGDNIDQECREDQAMIILKEGWAVSYNLMRDGERQILDLQIAGDVVGLRQNLFSCDDWRIDALTPVTGTKLAFKDYLSLASASSNLTRRLWWAATFETASATERLISLGRRNALQRVVHFFLELRTRLRMAGLASHDGFQCPLSQNDLADLLGISPVHVSRVMKQLRELDLMLFRSGKVTFLNIDGMIEVVEFSETYLTCQAN